MLGGAAAAPVDGGGGGRGGGGGPGGVVLVRSCHDDIHPNPHGFRAGGHHIEKTFVGLDAEGQAGTGALE